MRCTILVDLRKRCMVREAFYGMVGETTGTKNGCGPLMPLGGHLSPNDIREGNLGMGM